MKRIRLDRHGARRERPWREVLPPDPRDPDVVRVKALARAAQQSAGDQQVIKLTSGQHKPRERRSARGSLLRRTRQALRRGARAIRDFNSEQIGHWERFHQAGRSLVTHEGPLAWVSTLDGYWLVGRHLPVPAGTGLMGPSSGQGQSFTGEGTP